MVSEEPDTVWLSRDSAALLFWQTGCEQLIRTQTYTYCTTLATCRALSLAAEAAVISSRFRTLWQNLNPHFRVPRHHSFFWSRCSCLFLLFRFLIASAYYPIVRFVPNSVCLQRDFLCRSPYTSKLVTGRVAHLLMQRDIRVRVSSAVCTMF